MWFSKVIPSNWSTAGRLGNSFPHSDPRLVIVAGTTKPVNWRKPVFELDESDPDNNGFINEDLIVWMRTAALPTFRKLYRIIQKKPNMVPTLPSGNYVLSVTYSILRPVVTKPDGVRFDPA